MTRTVQCIKLNKEAQIDQIQNSKKFSKYYTCFYLNEVNYELLNHSNVANNLLTGRYS